MVIYCICNCEPVSLSTIVSINNHVPKRLVLVNFLLAKSILLMSYNMTFFALSGYIMHSIFNVNIRFCSCHLTSITLNCLFCKCSPFPETFHFSYFWHVKSSQYFYLYQSLSSICMIKVLNRMSY